VQLSLPLPQLSFQNLSLHVGLTLGLFQSLRQLVPFKACPPSILSELFDLIEQKLCVAFLSSLDIVGISDHSRRLGHVRYERGPRRRNLVLNVIIGLSLFKIGV